MKSDVINVIVADDHRLVRSGIVKILSEEENIAVIAEAENGKEAIEKCEVLSPDVLLLDLDMPLLNGMEAIPLLQKRAPSTRIGILTMHQEPYLVKKLLKMGVSGYLYKSSDPAELLDGVLKIASGKRYYTSEVTENLVMESNNIFNNKGKEQMVLLSQLSDREKEILLLISEGMSNTLIGDKLHISARTVETHRSNLMKKLNVKNMAGLIRFAITSGLVH